MSRAQEAHSANIAVNPRARGYVDQGSYKYKMNWAVQGLHIWYAPKQKYTTHANGWLYMFTWWKNQKYHEHKKQLSGNSYDHAYIRNHQQKHK